MFFIAAVAVSSTLNALLKWHTLKTFRRNIFYHTVHCTLFVARAVQFLSAILWRRAHFDISAIFFIQHLNFWRTQISTHWHTLFWKILHCKRISSSPHFTWCMPLFNSKTVTYSYNPREWYQLSLLHFFIILVRLVWI